MGARWLVAVERTGRRLGNRIVEANTFRERARGLLGTKAIEEGEGMWIRRCNAIHMVGMKYPIDVAFVADDHTVVKMIHAIRPNRVSSICLGAADALELPKGVLEREDVRVGDRLVFTVQDDVGLDG